MTELDPLMSGRDEKDTFFMKFVRTSLAEFVGTTVFVFIGCMSVQTGDVGTIAIAHGLTISLLIMTFGHISGGHFNPVVSLGVWITGGINLTVALSYFVFQMIGGMVGAGLVKAVLPGDVYNGTAGGANVIGSGVEPGLALLTEAILSFLLVLTVTLTAVDDNNTELAPLAIGFTVAVDIMAGANTSGASMNPARSLGPAIAYTSYNSSLVWDYHYIYWIGPPVGAIIAAAIYRIIFASASRRMIKY